ncbi:MAG TPA: hypothetical protein VD833_21090 [Vicinamibacterales bacterium]|nr:hypothetical protein [Vicinamibacterales bacterium]
MDVLKIRTGRLALAGLLTVGLAVPATAQTGVWDQRTTITVSEPVMVPGATLQPGTYVFELVESDANRNIVRIMNEDESRVVTTAIAIPAKRLDVKGDTVLRFNPTGTGTPAIEAWFYPGVRYGHRFVYDDKDAKEIAARTKTLVLSKDQPGTDASRGTLYTYDAEGVRSPHRDDTSLNEEWSRWYSDMQANASARVAKPGQGDEDRADSTAPMITADPAGIQVSVDDLEEHGSRYVGKVVNVTAEVESVFGPRMFTIDEPNWGDLDGEVLVHVPTNLAALVREDDRVTITGTMKPFVSVEFEKEWGWLDPEDGIEADLEAKPVLVASRIVGGDSGRALLIEVRGAEHGGGESGSDATSLKAPGDASKRKPSDERPVGTSGTTRTTRPAGASAASNLQELATAGREVVGRSVDLEQVRVEAEGRDGGFFVGTGGTRIFVLTDAKAPTAGETVVIDGVVLEMPKAMRDRLNPSVEWNDEIYVYATGVHPAK